MEKTNWSSKMTLEHLRARANLLNQLRAFLTERGYLEVQTPLLCQGAATDIGLNPIPVTLEKEKTYYLQTSPEFAMKRLLAQFQCPIFQICHAFRGAEHGRNHNPEFWMVEWYRPNWTYEALMDETDQLMQTVAKTPPAQKISYQNLFFEKLNIDPLTASDEQLVKLAEAHDYHDDSRSQLLDFLFSHLIEPDLGQQAPMIVYDYPAESASLAKVKEQENPVAMRFELYYKGLELANGYDELLDPAVLKARFKADNRARTINNLPTIPEDKYLLAAMEAGLPQSAGIALGFDRLLMTIQQCQHLEQVIPFLNKDA